MLTTWLLFFCATTAAKPSYGEIIDEIGHILGVNTPQTDGDPFPLPDKVNDWESFHYVDGTKCMQGETTGAWLRRGRDPTKLMVYFQEGGGCFNVVTCAVVYNNPTGFSRGDPGIGGIFNPDDERNAWRDYSIVFIPYCTGDVHMGSKISSVAFSSRNFYGRHNLNLVMQRLVPTFPNIKDLVVTGESAGGFGAIANFDFIVQGWSGLESKTMVDDCGPIFNDDYLAPCLQRQWRDLWGATPNLPPDCPQCTKPDGGGLYEMYEFLQKKYPSARFALIESVRDSVISFFFGFGNNNGQCNQIIPGLLPTFEEGLRNAAETYLGERFATMLFEGSSHTYLTKSSFFTEAHEGVYLYYWLQALMEDKFMKINPWDSLEGADYLRQFNESRAIMY